MDRDIQVLDRLMATIEQRGANPPKHSYTGQLLAGGVDTIGAKILEEASEVVDAAREQGETAQQHLVAEVADLVYHLLVLLGYRQARFSDVEAELERRLGTSGLDEKASREE